MVVIKISHEATEEFLAWFSTTSVSVIRNGGQGVYCRTFSGTEANYYELTGNAGVLCYAKTKWG